MFEIDKKNFKKGNKSAIFLILIGLFILLIFGGLEIFLSTRKNGMDRKTNVTDITENGHFDDENNYVYSPIFYYSVQGKEYSCKSITSSSKRPTKDIIIYYKSSDPSKCISSYEMSGNWMLIVGAALGGIILGIGIVMLVNSKKVYKKAKYLTTNGKLIKNIPYRLEGTGTYINGENVKKIVIDYILPNGLTKTLVGNSRYDLKTEDDDKLVDLLIDPNNLDNYYIDFDIKYSEGAQVEFYSGPIPGKTQTQQENPTVNSTPVQETVVNNQANDLQNLSSIENTSVNNQQ